MLEIYYMEGSLQSYLYRSSTCSQYMDHVLVLKAFLNYRICKQIKIIAYC